MEDFISKPLNGMDMDHILEEQPDGTYRFALNVVESSIHGENILSLEDAVNESGNFVGKDKIIILGYTNISDQEAILFTYSEEKDSNNQLVKVSSIYKLRYTSDNACKELITDRKSTQKLNFNPEYRIQAITRIRNNNEIFVYWTDNLNKPRRIQIQDDYTYYKSENELFVDRFNLFLKSSHIPQLEAEVVNTGGSLPAGKYIVMIQYVDNQNNGTNWVETTHEMIVYHASFTDTITRIYGSTNIDFPIYNKGLTSKGIEVRVGNLDPNFPYYRLGLLCANTGLGKFDRILRTDRIPNKQLIYTITGNEFVETGVQSIENFLDYIETAKTLAILDNRLLLGNIQNIKKDYSKLQQYASKICAIGVVEKQQQNKLERGCNRHFSSTYYSAGYCPGEAYSFGIVYIYKDGTTSPVFHIPCNDTQSVILELETENIKLDWNGRNYLKDERILQNLPSDRKYLGILRLNKKECQLKYIGKQWGELNNTYVGFHQFPYRQQDLYSITNNFKSDLSFRLKVDYCYEIELRYYSKKELEQSSCSSIIKNGKDYWLSAEECSCLQNFNYNKKNVNDYYSFWRDKDITLKLTVKDVFTDSETIYTLELIESYNYDIIKLYLDLFSCKFTILSFEEIKYIEAQYLETQDDKCIFLVLKRGGYKVSITKIISPSNLTIYEKVIWGNKEEEEITKSLVGDMELSKRISISDFSYVKPSSESKKVVLLDTQEIETHPYGVCFFNIKKPSEDIIGYYIVRQERTLQHSSIIDSACLMPVMNSGAVFSVQDSKKSAFGIIPFNCIKWYPTSKYTVPHTNVEEANTYSNNSSNFMNMKYSDKVFAAIIPTQLFREEYQVNFTKIRQIGNLNIEAYFAHQCGYKDVKEGSSYVEGVHDKKEYDSTGFQLFLQTREIFTTFETVTFETAKFNSDIRELNYVKALEHIRLTGYKDECFNLSLDNRICFIQPSSILYYKNNKIPLVYLERKNKNQYFDYLQAPYYKLEKQYFGDSNTSFCYCNGGDVYISSMPFVTTSFVDVLLKYRETKEKEREGLFYKLMGIGIAVVGAIIGLVGAIFTAGTSIVLMFAAIGVGAAIIAAGAYMTKSGIEIENMLEVFQKKWKLGLRDTIKDGLIWQYMQRNVKTDDYRYVYDENGDINYEKNDPKNPGDDCVEYVGTVIRDLWFESRYNFDMRFNIKNSPNLFLPNYKTWSLDYNQTELWYSEKDDWNEKYVNFDRLPDDECSQYVISKLLEVDERKKSGKSLRPIPLAEWYSMNFDYLASNNAQQFFCLSEFYKGLDAEILSKRIIYSNASNNEGITDEFSQFQPNNYIDIVSTTGDVTNLFTFNRQLFVHTERGLWYLPENIQERTTGEAGIVSFIGTGDFFSLPPRRVSEDEIFAGGCVDVESVVKTDNAVFWVSRSDRKIYQFNGQQLIPISDLGMKSWFGYAFDDSSKNRYYGVYDKTRKRVLFAKATAEKSEYSKIGSFTISFTNEGAKPHWISFHSYCQEDFIRLGKSFLTYKDNHFWDHDLTPFQYNDLTLSFEKDSENNYVFYPFILDIVLKTQAFNIQTWEDISFKTRAIKRVSETISPSQEDLFKTFNKIMFYNNTQVSKLKDIKTKPQLDKDLSQYLITSMKQADNYVLANRDEELWHINNIRAVNNDGVSIHGMIRQMVNEPINFITTFNEEMRNYAIGYTEKHAKSLTWQEATVFRGTALAVRFIHYANNTSDNGRIQFIMATAKGQKSER
jgi:hypothetical protein